MTRLRLLAKSAEVGDRWKNCFLQGEFSENRSHRRHHIRDRDFDKDEVAKAINGNNNENEDSRVSKEEPESCNFTLFKNPTNPFKFSLGRGPSRHSDSK